MTRRRWWLVAAVAVVAVDLGAWLLAVRALGHGAQDWVMQRQAAGVAVDLGDGAAGGAPWAATLSWNRVAVGPTGVVGGATLLLDVTAELSILHPDRIELEVHGIRAMCPGAPDLTATATAWTVLLPSSGTGLSMRIASLDGRWGDAQVTAHLLVAQAVPTSTGDWRLTLAASDMDVAPMAWLAGRRWEEFSVDAVLRGGLPASAASAAASARAWRDGGGRVDPLTAAIVTGPLAASLKGRLGLDTALDLEGLGVLHAHGLPALVDQLAAAGEVPPQTGRAVSGILALLPRDPGGAVSLPVAVKDLHVSVAGFPLLALPRPAWDRETITDGGGKRP